MGRIIQLQRPGRVRDSHWAVWSYEHVAKRLCITRQRVEQIEKIALRKLRVRLMEYARLSVQERNGEISEGSAFRYLCRCQMENDSGDRAARQYISEQVHSARGVAR